MALIDSRRATAGRLRRIGDSLGPIKLPAVEESCNAKRAPVPLTRGGTRRTRASIHCRSFAILEAHHTLPIKSILFSEHDDSDAVFGRHDNRAVITVTPYMYRICIFPAYRTADSQELTWLEVNGVSECGQRALPLAGPPPGPWRARCAARI
ncbi:hypothetical protein EVAR_7818_1 [Eumeta japonica]|uniref:Uncharacterized protein n=1 Tax=Eumeta variegata TaxID=151549 RepID=A0A4C1TUX7_EUMVA|nr:hypothetical protein EVAR_7818_1 [Eumeta japonica]